MAEPIPSSTVIGAVLAGGRARRMGGTEKAFVELGGRPLLAHVIERLRPQVGALIISANGDPGRFAPFGLPVVRDAIEGFAGPLAGILAAMNWAQRNAPKAKFVATVAVDTPFFPPDLVQRLSRALDDANDLAVSQSNGRIHPVVGLFPIGLADDLLKFLGSPHSRAVMAWIERYRSAVVPFHALGEGAADPFFNVNTPDDLSAAEAAARGGDVARPLR
jgi:molybdenum cofactor guanylyltransferase